jgi:hypothetical protein
MADINPIDLQKALAGASYPADKEQLVDLARDNGADDGLVEAISSASTDRFEGPDQVQKAIFSD